MHRECISADILPSTMEILYSCGSDNVISEYVIQCQPGTRAISFGSDKVYKKLSAIY